MHSQPAGPARLEGYIIFSCLTPVQIIFWTLLQTCSTCILNWHILTIFTSVQKDKHLIQNSPAVKKGAAPKRPLWKKMWNPRWRPRNSCDGRLMEKILIMWIFCLLHVSLGFGTKFTWIVVIKHFTISLPSQPFLGRHLGFHIFFHNGLLGVAPFFI